MIVSDASPLIYLSKINQLELLKKLFGNVFIPGEVYQEVVIRGKIDSHSDAIIIERAVGKWINIVKINDTQKLANFEELDKGEMETIILALNKKANLVLIDEACGREIARNLGLNVKGTVYVLLLAYQKKILSREEIKKSFELLIGYGFRLAPELYAKILNRL